MTTTQTITVSNNSTDPSDMTNATTYWITYSHDGTELFNEFTGAFDMREIYRTAVRKYNELKLAGDFATAALAAEDANAVSDHMIQRWGANETWLSSLLTDAQPENY